MADSRGPSILFVDDDPAMLLLADRIFAEKAPHCRVHKAAEARQAIAHIEKQPVDVVLCDHRLERADGIDVLATALRRQPEAVRILMSGFCVPTLLEEARNRAQIHDLIEKPISFQALEAVLTERVVRTYLDPLASGARPSSCAAN